MNLQEIITNLDPQVWTIGGGSLGALLLLIVLINSLKKKRPDALKTSQPTSEATKTPEAVTEEAKVEEEPPAVPKKSFLASVKSNFSTKLDQLLLSTKSFDDEFSDNLEELLYTSDLGPKTVERLLETIRLKLSRGELNELQTVKLTLKSEITDILTRPDPISSRPQGLEVILVVGVNGVGKTTSIGKMAHAYVKDGRKVMVVAGDTFRAAAGEQLSVWGDRAQVPVYSSDKTTDAAAVAFEGVQKAKADGMDLVIIDTAGRLHNKDNLMEELKKVKRVIGKAHEGAPHQILLVVDGNSGQNALVQAREFHNALELSGLVVTKLDGTARGGILVGIADELGVGAKFVGTGEKIGDLEPFSPNEYTKGLLMLDE